MPIILVVDDDPDLRGALAAVLAADHDVRQAEDGSRALDAIREKTPDLVLLDMTMPGLSGLDVLALARREAPAARFIVLTSRQDVDLAREALALGAAEYVTKPFDAAYIKEEVARLLAPPRREDDRPWRVAS